MCQAESMLRHCCFSAPGKLTYVIHKAGWNRSDETTRAGAIASKPSKLLEGALKHRAKHRKTTSVRLPSRLSWDMVGPRRPWPRSTVRQITPFSCTHCRASRGHSITLLYLVENKLINNPRYNYPRTST